MDEKCGEGSKNAGLCILQKSARAFTVVPSFFLITRVSTFIVTVV